jgi:hypothetical protein
MRDIRARLMMRNAVPKLMSALAQGRRCDPELDECAPQREERADVGGACVSKLDESDGKRHLRFTAR